jgi:MoxR-like ATPase
VTCFACLAQDELAKIRVEKLTTPAGEPAQAYGWKQLYEGTREMLTAYIDNFQLLQDEHDKAVDAMERANSKKARASKLVATLKREMMRLRNASRWLKEQREASLKGGRSLLADRDACFQTMMRADQEIEAFFLKVQEALNSGRESGREVEGGTI